MHLSRVDDGCSVAVGQLVRIIWGITHGARVGTADGAIAVGGVAMRTGCKMHRPWKYAVSAGSGAEEGMVGTLWASTCIDPGSAAGLGADW